MPEAKPIRVFIDANVLFSACKPRSKLRRIVRALCKEGAAVSSSIALGEARKNLEKKKPEWLEHLPSVNRNLVIHDSYQPVVLRGLPETDLKLFQIAVSAGCTHFVTGDLKHFGPWMGKEVHGVNVVEPHDLAIELDGLGWEI